MKLIIFIYKNLNIKLIAYMEQEALLDFTNEEIWHFVHCILYRTDIKPENMQIKEVPEIQEFISNYRIWYRQYMLMYNSIKNITGIISNSKARRSIIYTLQHNGVIQDKLFAFLKERGIHTARSHTETITNILILTTATKTINTHKFNEILNTYLISDVVNIINQYYIEYV